MDNATATATATNERGRWWARTLFDALIAGGIGNWAFYTDPSDLGLSQRNGLAVAVFAGVVLAVVWTAISHRDLVTRLTGASLGVILSAFLLLLPWGTIQVSAIGTGLVMGTVAGLVLLEVWTRYARQRD